MTLPSSRASLALSGFHTQLGAHFGQINGSQIVARYGDAQAEYDRLRQSAGMIDLSCRGRLCLTGADRQRFLHGQVTNDVKGLPVGRGCYAALVSAKGKMQSDLNLYQLQDELLLDFEPGLTESVVQRLENYIVADDVQILDVASHYGLLSFQGPAAATAIQNLNLGSGGNLPADKRQFMVIQDVAAGDIYCMNLPRVGAHGFDLFVPIPALEAVASRAVDVLTRLGGGPCGWDALEIRRIESGIPRFGSDADIDASNLAPEALDMQAISYTKGCYIGQEIIARIRTYGQVAKALKGLQFHETTTELPRRGDKLFHDGQEAGYVTSATRSPQLQTIVALAYVRREHSQVGNRLTVRTMSGEVTARIVELPFGAESGIK